MAGTAPWVPDDAIAFPCTTCGAKPRWDCTRPDGSQAPRFHHARLAVAQAAERQRRKPVAVIQAEDVLCEQPLKDGRQCPSFPSVRTQQGKHVCGKHHRYLATHREQEVPS